MTVRRASKDSQAKPGRAVVHAAHPPGEQGVGERPGHRGSFSGATNTIHQGDTRMLALKPLVADHGWKIYWARSDVPWPGEAAVAVSMFAMVAPDDWSTRNEPAEAPAVEQPTKAQKGNPRPEQTDLFGGMLP